MFSDIKTMISGLLLRPSSPRLLSTNMYCLQNCQFNIYIVVNNDLFDGVQGGFMMALCGELATEGTPDGNRQLAGLFLKNLITAQVCLLLNSCKCENAIWPPSPSGRTGVFWNLKLGSGLIAMRLLKTSLEQGYWNHTRHEINLWLPNNAFVSLVSSSPAVTCKDS